MNYTSFLIFKIKRLKEERYLFIERIKELNYRLEQERLENRELSLYISKLKSNSDDTCLSIEFVRFKFKGKGLNERVSF